VAIRRAVIVCAGVAAICAAQQGRDAKTAVTPEIKGAVVEMGTNQLVPNAEIVLSVKGPSPINGGWEPDASKTIKSDLAGGFTIQLEKLGAYRVDAGAEGYKGGLTSSGFRNYQEVTLTSENPTAQVRLFLYRPGSLAGHVVDEETRKPLGNVRVKAAQVRDFAGSRSFGGISGTTDADGHFLVSNLIPGDYTAEIGLQTETKKRVMTESSEKELQAVDQDFEPTYWPGGHGQEMAVSVLVPSGATVDIGQVRVRKVPYYRVHIHTVPASACEAGDLMVVYQQVLQNGQFTGRIFDLAEVPCGKDLLVTGFLPGSHRLILAGNEWIPGRREVTSVPFVIIDKNIEITASLERGVVVEGTVAAAEGAKPPDLSNVQVSLDSLEMVRYADMAPVRPVADGKFRILGVHLLSARVMVAGIGVGHYLKEMRYNGIAAADGLIPLDKSALSHSLTIILDDKPATVGGSVMDGDKPVQQPYVVLKKWPAPDGQGFNLGTLTSTGDNKGRFQFTSLPPGEYRIIALRSRDEYVYRAPGTLERAMVAAKKIELSPRAFQTVDLELRELR
jgi:hypothetical protein